MTFQFDYFLRMFSIIFLGLKNTVSMALLSLSFCSGLSLRRPVLVMA